MEVLIFVLVGSKGYGTYSRLFGESAVDKRPNVGICEVTAGLGEDGCVYSISPAQLVFTEFDR